MLKTVFIHSPVVYIVLLYYIIYSAFRRSYSSSFKYSNIGPFFSSSVNFLFLFSSTIISTRAAIVGNAKAKTSQMLCAVFAVKNLKVKAAPAKSRSNIVNIWFFISSTKLSSGSRSLAFPFHLAFLNSHEWSINQSLQDQDVPHEKRISEEYPRKV